MSNSTRRTLIVVGIIIAAIGLTATLLSFRKSDQSVGRAAPAVAPTAPKDDLERLSQKVAAKPKDWMSLAALGEAYVQKARVAGDPTLYPLADRALARSLKINPQGNRPAMTGESSLAAARHNFGVALDWAQKADAAFPDDPHVKAVLADALVELGRYPEAFGAFQRMVDLRPDLAAYTRVAHARDLQGDVQGAIQAMQAADASANTNSDAAFTQFSLGELYWNSGQVEEALTHYRRSAKLNPSYLPPQAALARASFFTGPAGEAARQYKSVTERNPFPQYVGDYADVAALTGRNDLVKPQLEVLAAQQQLFKANGVNSDVEIALFNVDHGIDLSGSLSATQAEWALRPSITVADDLAWTLHANGRDSEALDYANQALHLGSRNALYFYHRARINEALNNHDAAKADLQQALAINPNFSIQHAREARLWATQLGIP